MSNEFKSSYEKFSSAVINDCRYIQNEEAKTFLNEILKSYQSRLIKIEKGHFFWRAQLGSDICQITHPEGFDIDVPCGHYSERMRPLKSAAGGGRVNSQGISCLYLATTRETAMSEVRPWIGDEVSVAQFKTNKDLKIIDCSRNPDYCSRMYGLLNAVPNGDQKPDLEKDTFWAGIDHAFSKPTSQDDTQEQYLPTQIISEFLKSKGFDGIFYKSMLAENGYNIALFDPQVADPINCFLHEVKKIAFEFLEDTLYQYQNNN